MEIGFIGQGYVGKNYADDFEKRGYRVVRYSLEEPYRANKEKIRSCEVVFIAVPTPTKPTGFDAGTVKEVLSLVGKKKIAVIKSTLVPGLTARFQREFPSITILFSPEFLSVKTAAHDAAHPFLNIIGLPKKTETHYKAARKVHSILPRAGKKLTCNSIDAELFKYAHNGNGFSQVLFYNMIYDLATALGADWNVIIEAAKANPFMSTKYANPFHKNGRGAGGFCFIKDFAALRMAYEDHVGNDVNGIRLLRALEAKNIDLLTSTGKDLDILKSVHGDVAPVLPTKPIVKISSRRKN